MAAGSSYSKLFIFAETSFTKLSGSRPINSAARVLQSKLFTWSARTAPVTDNPVGTRTSNGYPLTWLVIGQQRARPTFALYETGDRTSAGRRPACSCPA